MDLTVLELKQIKKQLETKEAEKAKVEQAAYDAGMTKEVESLTSQLRDVARAFYLEVWGQALDAVGVSTESELWAFDKVYYPPTLRLVPNLPQPPTDPSFAPPSSLAQPNHVPSPTLVKGKEKKKELPLPANVQVVEVEEEVVKVVQLKRKKKEKEQEKKGTKEKEPIAQLSFSLGDTQTIL